MCLRIATYLGLEKSCGRSLGPSGTLGRPRSAGLLMAGGGRDADMAFEALVLRSRLPFSVVFWNLRTRSSTATSQCCDTQRYIEGSYLRSRSTLRRTHSSPLGLGGQSCPWCVFLFARVRTCSGRLQLSLIHARPGCAVRSTALRLPRASSARRQLPSVELGPRSRLCGHFVAECAAAVRAAFPRILGSERQRDR